MEHKICFFFVSTRSSSSRDYIDEYGSYSEYVTQHDFIRQLARHQSKLDPAEQRKRLVIDISGSDPSSYFQKEKPHPNAKLVSITTGKNLFITLMRKFTDIPFF